MDLFFVTRNGIYHKGPGITLTHHVEEAGLYPEQVARKIADRYPRADITPAIEHMHNLIDRQQERLETLLTLRTDILSGKRTFIKPGATEQLVSLWEMEDEIREMPGCKLKGFLLDLLEDIRHEDREAART